ncbi:MAG TPA: hypothetical protein EYH50_03235 [Pyrodictium delaneyi]|uniref:Uncharacterized protein n=1 Tax=Pyrodictium delaneyi TaxID=1273541 RepID=A0A832ZUC5_9CREN|nr:hypothetical protein [Pyrodictium delaneyi]
MTCSTSIYVDATGSAINVLYETTCEMLYMCCSAEVEVVGGSAKTSRENGCIVAQSRSGKMTLRLRYDSDFYAVLTSTPARPVLPQPYPPYAVINASIVVDTKPGIDVYGLPFRKTGVVTLTQRTLLEGRSVLQLAIADTVVDESVAIVKQLDWLEASYPLLSGIEAVDELKYCEALRGYGLRAWGECVNRLGGIVAGEHLAALNKALENKIVFEALASRLYAGTGLNSAIDPLSLAKRLYERKQIAPVMVSKQGKHVVIEGLSGVTLWLRSRLNRVERIEGVKLGNEPIVVDEVYREVAIVCRWCWEPLQLFEKHRLVGN